MASVTKDNVLEVLSRAVSHENETNMLSTLARLFEAMLAGYETTREVRVFLLLIFVMWFMNLNAYCI